MIGITLLLGIVDLNADNEQTKSLRMSVLSGEENRNSVPPLLEATRNLQPKSKKGWDYYER